MPKPNDAKTKLKSIGNKYTMPVINSHEPSWTLDEGLSFSGFQMWLQCREQFRLTYIQGWRPVEQQDSSLYYGSLVHRLIELRPDPKDLGKLEFICDGVATTLGNAAELKAKAAAVYRVYHAHHKLAKEDRIDAGAEKRFDYTYKFSYDGKSYEVPLMGYIDCVYRPSKKEIGVRETKTRVQMDIENTEVALKADLQVNSYFLACEQVLDKFPSEVTYDLVKRPAHERKTDKAGNTESLSDFHNRVFDAVMENPSSYLHRIPYRRSFAEFNVWRSNVLHPHLRDFVEWYRRCEKAKWQQIDPYNPAALVGKYGLCRLFHLLVSGDVSGLTKKGKRRDGETQRQEDKQQVPSRRPNRTKR